MELEKNRTRVLASSLHLSIEGLEFGKNSLISFSLSYKNTFFMSNMVKKFLSKLNLRCSNMTTLDEFIREVDVF